MEMVNSLDTGFRRKCVANRRDVEVGGNGLEQDATRVAQQLPERAAQVHTAVRVAVERPGARSVDDQADRADDEHSGRGELGRGTETAERLDDDDDRAREQ